MAASHLAQIVGRDYARQAMELRSMALRCINKSLADYKAGISDKTILAIMALCVYEVSEFLYPIVLSWS